MGCFERTASKHVYYLGGKSHSSFMLQCFLFLTFFYLWDIFLAVRTSIYQVTLPICSCMLCILSISTLNIYIFTTKMFISHSHLYPLQAIGGTSLLYLN